MKDSPSAVRGYKMLLTKHPLVMGVLLTLYFLFGVTFVLQAVYRISPTEVLRGPIEAPKLRSRVQALEASLAEKDALINRLSKESLRAPHFSDLSFEENWISEEARASVIRLLEYAAFAVGKEDYRHAERMFEEANLIQETISAAYQQGRLGYARGDLRMTTLKWRRAIELDQESRYAILRFYLAIVYHELAEEERSRELVREYVQSFD